MEGGRERDHLVTLKEIANKNSKFRNRFLNYLFNDTKPLYIVMRLTKPSLMMTQPISCSPRDLPRTTFNDVMHRDLAGVQGLEHFALGELLTLPQNFGNIFLGETFSSYISVHNDSGQTCKEILVKADLQTRSQRLQLSGANAQVVPELAPGQSIDDVIHHEVKELDTHILVCAVSYTTQSGEKMYFRKFFKFQVLKPLDVKTKFYNAVSDEVYLEAQIQNITPGPIYMERVMLDPSPQYTTEQLGSEDSIESKTRVFGSVNYMNPMDIRQYLYCLTPTLETYSDAKQLKDLTSVGKLDIMWKTSMGEKGRLQTSTLQRVPPGHGDIILSVESIPEAVIIEKTFNVTIKVTNCSEVTMDLVLELYNSNKTGLLWCGTSGRQLPKLAANGNVTLDLSILAIRQGLQSVSGLRLTDSFLKRTYEHDDVAQVFIHDDDSQS